MNIYVTHITIHSIKFRYQYQAIKIQNSCLKYETKLNWYQYPNFIWQRNLHTKMNFKNRTDLDGEYVALVTSVDGGFGSVSQGVPQDHIQVVRPTGQ